jgi:dienelactone hydrolase
MSCSQLILTSVLFTLLACDSKEKTELCVGHYLTEEEAVEKLNQYRDNYSNAQQWNFRAKAIKENIWKGAGLDQIQRRDWEHPITTTQSARRQMDGYTVENMALEVKDNHFITGNLYRPDSIIGKIPVILSPHGHWSKLDDYGRFRDDMQLRCASLARMGAAVFAYDMYGYGEDLAHYHKDQEALKWQTYNGIRILDFVSSLDYVDTTRIGITGASGGGTQSFVLAAIDQRIDVSVPVVMVSAHFFGGCVCESGLPIHKRGDFETNNVEIAAAIAPKPLMLISDGEDWTKNVPQLEFPYVKDIYQLFNAQEQVEYAHFELEGHDYGVSKRKEAYKFLAKHLNLDYSEIIDQEGKVTEQFVTVLDTTALKVFPERSLVQDPNQPRANN